MKKKVLQSLLPLLILTTMVAGCGKNEAAIEPTEIVSETTEVTATEETETTETEEAETEVTEETETQETETQEPTEEAESEAATEEKQTDASKETNNTTKETASTSESTTAAPQAETAPPVENNSQPAEQTQIVTSSADQIVQGSTGTTSFGTTYPIVSEFNKVALNPDATNFFSTSDYGSEFAVAFGQGNKALGDALGYNYGCIDVTNSYIGCGDADITRKPESGYYVFTYGTDITEAVDGGEMARARHQVMLAVITSNPVEVENALFQAMWGDDPYNIGSNQWVTVGDCKILYAYGNPNEGEWRYEFAIKPAN